MFLQPQHFQQTERYFLNSLSTRIGFEQPYFFGVTEIEFDKDALSNELVTLTRCTGVLPDGTPFTIPREDAAPASRSFSDHLTHDQQSLDVYLAVPLTIEGRGNVQGMTESSSAFRYRSKRVAITDEILGSQRKEIEIGALNFMILFGDESLDNYASIAVGKLRRNQSGAVEFQDTYIPPLLQIGASRFLMNQVRSLLEMLLAKNASLSQGRKQLEGGFAEFSGAEETPFRLLQTLNMFTPLINHSHFIPSVHPFELFKTLTMFAGALTTFSIEVSLKNLPHYDHQNLSGTFGGLIKIIRTVLEADISAGCVPVPIEQVNQATFVCKVSDEKLLKAAKMYLGISAKVPEKELIVGALQRIKMCSRDRLDILISSAMPGLPLMHTAHPPEGLSTKPGYVYFKLDQQGQFWQGILTSGSIAFYFPNNYPDLKLEMLALKG